MATYDITRDDAVVICLPFGAYTTGTNAGTAIDMAGYHGLSINLIIGAWTNGTHAFKLTECDTSNGSFTDVAAGNVIGYFTSVTDATKDGTVQSVGYRGNKRYVKIVDTVSSGASGATMVAIAHKRKKAHV